MTAPEAPVLGDAVVLDGRKYRIRSGVARELLPLAAAGPAWRTSGIVAAIRPEVLTWDPRAGVWRPAGERPAAPAVLVSPVRCPDLGL